MFWSLNTKISLTTLLICLDLAYFSIFHVCTLEFPIKDPSLTSIAFTAQFIKLNSCCAVELKLKFKFLIYLNLLSVSKVSQNSKLITLNYWKMYIKGLQNFPFHVMVQPLNTLRARFEYFPQYKCDIASRHRWDTQTQNIYVMLVNSVENVLSNFEGT